MRGEDWKDEIVDAADATAGMPITWEMFVDNTELVRHDLRSLRVEVDKLAEAFGQQG